MTDDSRPGLRGNNLDLVRRRNLGLVLRRVHELDGISRASLTRETGLNRSTIAALVAELVQLELVVETVPEQTNLVGRPSPVIMPTRRAVAITVHPELDAATICLVALGGHILRRERFPTQGVPTPDEVVSIAASAIAGMAAELDEKQVVGIGLAVPGLVHAGNGVVTLAPHLEWRDVPLGHALHAATGYEVFAANDASLGAIAESVRGAGVDVDHLVYLNGGASGIGGGIIMDGALLGGASGYAGEIGHTLVNSAGVACHCGSSGCLETEVTRAPLLEALGLASSESESLERALVDGIAAGDGRLQALVDRQVGYLARALANTINTFNPRLILLGGFLGALYAASARQLESTTRALAMIGPRDDVTIGRATLGPGIIELGAAELAFGALIADPARTGHAGSQ
ncbi:ROK family transcriptional regulator [soil metagenome]